MMIIKEFTTDLRVAIRLLHKLSPDSNAGVTIGSHEWSITHAATDEHGSPCKPPRGWRELCIDQEFWWVKAGGRSTVRRLLDFNPKTINCTELLGLIAEKTGDYPSYAEYIDSSVMCYSFEASLLRDLGELGWTFRLKHTERFIRNEARSDLLRFTCIELDEGVKCGFVKLNGRQSGPISRVFIGAVAPDGVEVDILHG